jgi:ribonuclease J
MRLCIHRGAVEVGGTCIEIEHDGARLILDAGLPLGSDSHRETRLPAVDGLEMGDPSILGVIVSHGHPDHFGLVGAIHPSIPRFAGAGTQRILREAMFFTPHGIDLDASGRLADRRPLRLGPFTITPFLVDHSAFDAYALLVSVGGKQVLYSGDLRGHGRKAALFERLVAAPPPGVDVLLLEGTNLHRSAAVPALTEHEVEEQYLEICRSTDGMVLACYSAQNVDRLVSIFRAARRAGRILILDLYTAAIARATGHETIPQTSWNGVRVYVPLNQRVKVKRSGEFERVNWIRHRRIFPEELSELAGDAVFTFRASMATELERAGCLTDAHAVWSLWPGYLDEPPGGQLRGWFAERGIPLSVVHSSGHASVADLQRFAAAVNARVVVPVHSWHPERYNQHFLNVRRRADGEWWTV